MAVTSGFYNSVSGDRKYNALQMSSIFDGIIEDGVYSTIGDHFSVTAGTGNTVIVGTGRAWFNHTWTLNDADYPVTLEPSEVVLNRYDAIVIEVNGSNAVRGNSIKVIKGTPGSSPSKPSLAKGDNNIWQHPLAYVYVPAGSSSISQSNIEYVVGKSECPFVVAAVQSVNIDSLVAQWQDEFDTWFDNLEYQLSGDVAGNLQNQINQKVDKSNVIDNLEDLVANQASGMIAGAKAVAELNGNMPEYYNADLDYCIRFPGTKTQICYGTVTCDMNLGQNGAGYTGSTSVNHPYCKPFSALSSLVLDNAANDWFWIINKVSSNSAIQSITFANFTQYSNRQAHVNYIAMGKYSE